MRWENKKYTDIDDDRVQDFMFSELINKINEIFDAQILSNNKENYNNLIKLNEIIINYINHLEESDI